MSKQTQNAIEAAGMLKARGIASGDSMLTALARAVLDGAVYAESLEKRLAAIEERVAKCEDETNDLTNQVGEMDMDIQELKAAGDYED